MTNLEPLSEEQLQKLIFEAQEGSTEAFGKIYDQFADAIYRYSAFRVSEGLAEDITSEIFLKAWEKLHTYIPKKNIPFRAWLFRIARHTVIDAYRQQQDIIEMNDQYPDEDDLNRASSMVTKKHLIKTVRDSLGLLPRRYRDILELSFMAELPHEEVARILKMKPGGVRVLKFRALKKLETLLPPEIQEDASFKPD